MTEEQIIYFASQSLLLVLYLSLPVVVAATVIGLLVGLFQALTQIQDQTLAFGLKLVGVILVLLFAARWMGHELLLFTDQMYILISTVTR